MALNHITIMGRLTATPEKKMTQSGTAVTRFTLAVERDFKDKQTGEKITDFIDCIAWQHTADFVTRFFTKGRMAVVAGRLQLRDYTDKDGIKRRISEVVAENVYFADSATAGAGNAGNVSAGQQAEPTQDEPQYQELDNDEDLPF